MPEEQVKLWEQREDEGPEAFEAFATYRDMGNKRSLVKVAGVLGKSTQLMDRWNSKYQWRKRVVAKARHEARLVNEDVLLGTADMRTRLIMMSQNMQVRAAERIQNLTPQEIKAMNPSQVVQLFRAAADIEAKMRNVSEAELDGAERDDAPTFNIRFLPKKPDGMVSVRLKGGGAGYIPKERVEDFMQEHPDAVVIQ